MKVPKFILNQVFVRDSFQQTAEGVYFAFVNRLGPGVLDALHQITIGDHALTAEEIDLVMGEKKHSGDSISADNSLKVLLNDTVGFLLKGLQLDEGPYTITLNVRSKEMGPLTLSFDAALKN